MTQCKENLISVVFMKLIFLLGKKPHQTLHCQEFLIHFGNDHFAQMSKNRSDQTDRMQVFELSFYIFIFCLLF